MKTIDANRRSKSRKPVLEIIVNGQEVTIKNTAHLHGLAAGLKHGEVVIDGNAGTTSEF